MNKSKFSLELEDETNTEHEEVDKSAIKKFAKGALEYTTDMKDWRNENPNALPSYNFRLRLNKYQIGMLKYIANLEKRSISNLIKVMLLNEFKRKYE